MQEYATVHKLYMHIEEFKIQVFYEEDYFDFINDIPLYKENEITKGQKLWGGGGFRK